MKNYTLQNSPATTNSQDHSNPGDLHLAFDVGHSSIGWAVLRKPDDGGKTPRIEGCGAVTFGADDCLASKRRDFRRQRRHIRATKRRIERMEKLLAHLGAMSSEDLKKKHAQGGGHAAPWLLAARILASNGDAKHLLNWPQLWDVLRWYAHNRGYDGNRRWSDAEEAADDDTEKEENAKQLMKKHGVSTMAETFCKELKVDPFGAKQSSEVRFKGLNAAFPRATVENEVRAILEKHEGKLDKLDAAFTRSLMDDARVIACAAYKLSKRFDGGLLFGQFVPRFDNRIISVCPVSGGKSCAKTAPEFLLYRWLMQLANIRVVRTNPELNPALTKEERETIHKRMSEAGAFTPTEFERAVIEVTGCGTSNLKTMLMHPDAAKALVLDPVQKLIQSDRVQFLWPHLPERIQRRAKEKWRKGKVLTLRQLLAWCDETDENSKSVLQKANDAVAAKEAEKKTRKKPKAEKDDVNDPLDAPLKTERLSGRAPYARHILRQAADEVLAGLDPRKKCRANDPAGGEDKQKDGILVTTDAMIGAAQKKPLDQLTNNHLIRHRLLILQRLTADIVADPTLCGGNAAHIGSVAIEVNSELKELSGKSAKAVAQELGLRLANFKSVVKKLEAEGISDPRPGLIRKARILDDLQMQCPYTGHIFCMRDLLSDKVDKDHIIPHAKRPSNSLDSLVITFKAVNAFKKGDRTGLQFVEQEAGKPVPSMSNLHIRSPQEYRDFVTGLKVSRRLNPRTHEWEDTDDGRRQRRRKELLLKPSIDEKNAGFLPRDLTVTSHLTRLGALVMQRSLPHLEPHKITSLPGSVTGTIRTGWKLLGCLSAGNPGVLEQNGGVKTKTEIRDITHLHHALDAIVIGLTHHYFPKNGRLWEAMVRRVKQRTAEDNALLLATGLYQTTPDGVVFAQEPPENITNQVRARLGERRIVQYVPADMTGLKAEQNTWRVVNVKEGVATIRQQMRGPDGKRQPVKETTEKAGKLIGLEKGKLQAIKGALVVGDNYGLAILDHATDGDDRLAIIPWHNVWQRLQDLKKKNSGKKPRLIRNGMLIRLPQGRYAGTWRVFSTKATLTLDLGVADKVSLASKGEGQKREVQVKTLLRDGLEILQAPLTGIAVG
jgi:CRISPR-associated endonuclease Csn1